MPKTKTDYVDDCKKVFDKLQKQSKVIVRYNRDRKNRKNGVIIAYKDQNHGVMVGVSKCNTVAGDVFNRYVGLSRAIGSAAPIGEYYNNTFRQVTVPNSMEDMVSHQLEKVKRYFRVEI